MIGEDGERVFGPTQIVSPVGEGFHHSKQLSFVDVIVSLGRGECGGIVCDGVKFRLSLFVGRGVSFASLLGEHCSDSVGGGIGLQVKTSVEVGLNEDWLSTHKGFEHLEGFELSLSPVPH